MLVVIAASLMTQSADTDYRFALPLQFAGTAWAGGGCGGQELRPHSLHHGLDNGPAG
jgi:hypothetical protein